MAGAYGIEIVLLHQRQVLFNLWHTNGKTGFWIGIVAVYTPEFDFLSVEVNHFITDFNGPKSNVIDDGFMHVLLNDRNRFPFPNVVCS